VEPTRILARCIHWNAGVAPLRLILRWWTG
jgi:hypothetical protein